MIEVKRLLIFEDSTLRDAFKTVSRVLNTAFVVDKNYKFLGVITEGDITRALIADAKMEDTVAGYYTKDPLCVKNGKLNRKDLEDNYIYIIPVLNEDNEVIGYKTLKELKKTAFVSGITGQDGAYLAYLLLQKGYTVIGGYRRASVDTFERLRRLGILDRIILESFDVIDLSSIIHIIERNEPSEIYNLAAQTFVSISFTEPYSTAMYTAMGALNFLEAIKLIDPSIRFYQASSSEMFGNAECVPKNEMTPFKPSSPYAIAKVFGHMSTRNYRDSYKLFACSGILFNPESPLRGLEFVTRKIVHNAVKIKLGMAKELRLGNMKARRDWGYAYDYTKAMWLMLQQDEPQDYVIGTGKSYSVDDFARIAFNYLDLDHKKYIVIDNRLFRPLDVEHLLADPSKAMNELKWHPAATSIEKLIKIMVDTELDYLQGKPEIKVQG